MIIDASIFVGEITIAGTDNPVTSVKLDAFIEKYEPLFLEMLLGSALYTELVLGLAVQPIEAKWATLRDKVKPMIANYVYYWYIRNQVTQTTQVGNVKGKSENSTISSDGLKQDRAWNEMVRWVWTMTELYDWSAYQSYVQPRNRPRPSNSYNALKMGLSWYRDAYYPEIFFTINPLNL